MNNKEILNTIFKETFNIKDSEYDYKFTKESVDTWDSLGQITLVSEIENQFEVMFDTEDILELDSFDKAISILNKNDVSI